MSENIQCPVCGYYCLGKGGHGCIDKPSLIKKPISEPRTGPGNLSTAAPGYKAKLKPCPFCDGEAEDTILVHQPTGIEIKGVRCKQCGAVVHSREIWGEEI